MRKIKYSDHAIDKINLLKKHGFFVKRSFVENAINEPERKDPGYKDRYVVQRVFDEDHVMRVVCEEYPDYILVITIYPGKRKRYEKDQI